MWKKKKKRYNARKREVRGEKRRERERAKARSGVEKGQNAEKREMGRGEREQ